MQHSNSFYLLSIILILQIISTEAKADCQGTQSCPAGTQLSIPLTIVNQGNGIYPPSLGKAKISIVAGGQAINNITLDTGSSFLVIESNSIPSTSYSNCTNTTKTMSYSGGQSATGPVCSTMLSIGGLAPQPVWFLLDTSNGMPQNGTFGLGIGESVSLSSPVNPGSPLTQLNIQRYQIIMPTLVAQGGNWFNIAGEWVINGEPVISSAKGSYIFPYVMTGAAPYKPVLSVALSTNEGNTLTGNINMDTGTAGNNLTFFSSSWISALSGTSSSTLSITATAQNGNILPLVQSFPAGMVTKMPNFSNQDDAILGNGFLRNFVIGVDLVAQQISLLPMNSANINCLLNWAEASYPSTLSPPVVSPATAPFSVITSVSSPYIYRYYPNTKMYVGVNIANNNVYTLSSTQTTPQLYRSLSSLLFESECN